MSNLTYEQLVEKVSKAICMVNCHNPDAVLTDNLDHSKWEIYVPDARAAIATIAEATKERGELARVKSNANHIARMDPLTTLALITRIRELEAKSAADLADYETSLETMTAAHEAKVRELEAENAKLKHDIASYVEALTRQGNNMSFILNHMTIPDQYYEKFTRELSEDRAALAAAEAEENRNKG